MPLSFRRLVSSAVLLILPVLPTLPLRPGLASAAIRAGYPALPAPVAASARVSYRLPVRGTVIDPFRAPPNPYAAGNRGVEFGTIPGSPVVAAADGVVSFAGQVGGQLFVVVTHADGVRTTYGFLASVAATSATAVRQGDIVGLAAASVHWGARRGDTYFDPMTLLSSGPPRVRLVPEKVVKRARGP